MEEYHKHNIEQKKPKATGHIIVQFYLYQVKKKKTISLSDTKLNT